MPLFRVYVRKVTTATEPVEVEAPTQEEAERKVREDVKRMVLSTVRVIEVFSRPAETPGPNWHRAPDVPVDTKTGG
jgi:hypothetical protein